MGRKEFLPLALPSIGEGEKRAVLNTLESGWVTTGPNVRHFEALIARYTGAPHAVALGACTHALHLALLVLGIGPGDEVVTTPFTFAATANAILATGAMPVFADIEEETCNIDPRRIEERITERTRAILPVHYAGHPARLDEIHDIARRFGLFVVEDAAHAFGSAYRGRKIGAISDMTCFSFYATKNITTIEGGAVTTHREELARRIRILATQGVSRDAWKRRGENAWRYDVVEPGFKYTMNDVSAAIGIVQLGRIEGFLRRRRALAARYDAAFAGHPAITLPRRAAYLAEEDYARHLYPIRIDFSRTPWQRDRFVEALGERGIGAGVHYQPLHLHPCPSFSARYRRGDFPVAERVFASIVSLPFFPEMGETDVDHVAATVLEYLSRCA
ncbi:MAG: DegT/DnrJ/EryC1/StrS aminotransferase family protein [Deltaproteobacteria bacterium]|nr:MAG: DegT/DnrJ/EryC1/StrS aminotransferase family protein [Deltaproteobacteria bacterium]